MLTAAGIGTDDLRECRIPRFFNAEQLAGSKISVADTKIAKIPSKSTFSGAGVSDEDSAIFSLMRVAKQVVWDTFFLWG